MPITTLPAKHEPKYMVFSHFVSNMSNILRNVRGLKLSPEPLGLPVFSSKPDIYGSEKPPTPEEFWKLYDDSSFNYSHEAIEQLSWNTQHLKTYSELFDLQENPDCLVKLYKEHIGKLTPKNHQAFGRFLSFIEQCQALKNTAFVEANYGGEDYEEMLLKKCIFEEMLLKKCIFDVYFLSLLSHIKNENLQATAAGETLSAWNGKDAFSAALVKQLEAFQKLHSLDCDNAVRWLSDFLSKYPKLVNLLPEDKQSALVDGLIKWKLRKIESECKAQDFANSFPFPTTAKLDKAIFSKLTAFHEICTALIHKHGLQINDIKTALVAAWKDKATIESLSDCAELLKELAIATDFLKNNILADDVSSLTLSSFYSKEGQYKWFEHCFDKWAIDNKKSFGEHSYALSTQVLNNTKKDFEKTDSSNKVIEEIKIQFDLTTQQAIKQIERCEVMEYSHSSFSKLEQLEEQWSKNSQLDDTEKTQLRNLVTTIANLKKQYFYADNKPKLMTNIPKADVQLFYRDCCSSVDNAAKDSLKSHTGKECLYDLLKSLANIVIKILSFGKVGDFFATQPKEMQEIRTVLDEVSHNISNEARAGVSSGT